MPWMLQHHHGIQPRPGMSSIVSKNRLEMPTLLYYAVLSARFHASLPTESAALENAVDVEGWPLAYRFA